METTIPSKLALLDKLAKIKKLVEVIQKDQSGFNYKYISISEVLAKITAGMKKYNVSLIPRYVSGSANVSPLQYKKTKILKNGQVIEENVNEILTSMELVFTWIDNDAGEELSIPWFITGSQQDPSQALGSGLTYGLRQFLVQFFQIAQPQDDPDSWRSLQKEAEETENREIAKSIIEQVHIMVTGHVERVPDDRQKAYDIIKKYARDGKGKPSVNYNTIQDPVTAGKLMEEISELCQENSATE